MLRELKKLIEFGSDIELTIRGKEYVILPWTQEGIAIGERYSDDDEYFETADSLFNEYLIDGIPFHQLVDEMEITFSSGYAE